MRGNNIHIGTYTVIEDPVELGNEVWIGNYVHIRPGVKIGNWSHIRNYCIIEHDVTIGHNTRIFQMSNITAGCSIGSDCFLGPGVIMLNDRQIAYPDKSNFVAEPPVIEDRVRIGGNATILPGVRLCEGGIIGAGAVVTKSTEPWTVYVGNPAKALRIISRTAT